MNYGQKGKELILDLKRSDWLPPYNDETVRSTLSEISLHFDELNDQVHASRTAKETIADPADRPTTDDLGGTPSMPSRPALLLHDAAIRRNKRCLLAYHAYRLDRLKALRWDTSASLPPHVRALLSAAEVDFYAGYDKLVSVYNAGLSVAVGDGNGEGSDTVIPLDLNANLQPPEEDLIEVRVVQGGLGTIVTERWGEVSLELGTTHFLSRGDVEHLIRQ